VHLVELLHDLDVVPAEGARGAARALGSPLIVESARSARLSAERNVLALDQLDADVAQLEQVRMSRARATTRRFGKVLFAVRARLDVARGLSSAMIRDSADPRRGLQQVEPRRVAIERAEAELARLLDVVGIVVEHVGRNHSRAARARRPAYAPEPGDDNLAACGTSSAGA
jgi:uncharacterized protein with PIN domain